VKPLIGLLILVETGLYAQSTPGRSVFTGVPASARTMANPEAKDRDAALDGWRLFQQHCSQCHGATAGGGGFAPALINSEMHTATAGEIFWVITNGVSGRGMPSWSKLSEEQRWKIVAFLMSRNAAQGAAGEYGTSATAVMKPSWQRPVFAHVPVKDRSKRNPLANDPDAAVAGLKLFDQHCSTCHGTGGEGTRRGPRLANPQMQRATPGEIFWILTNGLVRHGMPSWSRLPEPERWQIVAFLTSLNGEPMPSQSTRSLR
jgi:mono/diheme cytochrome c family protein